MGILDKIKRKPEKQKKAKKEADVLNMVKEDKPKEVKEVKIKEDTGLAHRILKNYHLSEKSNLISAEGRYVFKVAKHTNKIEVKKAVESVYDVHVVSVNIVNLKGKNRRQGRQVGQTSAWKKAYVTLRAGEKISGLAEGI